MTELENFINAHRSDFDNQEPDSGHFKRFEQRLEETPAIKNHLFNGISALKVAAIIVFFISVSVIVFDLSTRAIKTRLFREQAVIELPSEVREAMQYYNQQADIQLGKINQLAGDRIEARELCQSALKEIKILNDNSAELEKNLSENPNNCRIQAAIIQNQKMKEGVLNTIISQLSLQKK